MIYPGEEDYLKIIFELTIENNRSLLRNNELAEHLGYSDQGVNEMVKKLDAKHLIEFIPYKGVHLTPAGITEAIKIIRRHRIWEAFLHQQLGFEWHELHSHAERLEHSTDDSLLFRMYEVLHFPTHCPHGAPIPRWDGTFDIPNQQALIEMEPGTTFRVERVIDQPEFLQLMQIHQINLGVHVLLVSKDDTLQETCIDYEGERITLSKKVASLIYGTRII